MPPKRGVPIRRRPAARKEVLKRPAKAEEEVAQKLRKFSQVSPVELLSLGPICIQSGVYYGRTVHLAGELVSLNNKGCQLYGEFKVSGTKDEELLRILTGKPNRLVTLHLCRGDCSQQLTDETLIHVMDFEAVDLRRLPWMTNLQTVEPAQEGEDEMEKLRREQERMEQARAEEAKEAKKDKRRKEDRRERKEGRQISPRKEDETLEVGQKDLKMVFGDTGMDPDVKRRSKMMKRARKLGQNKKKKKKKGSSSEGKESSTSSSSQSSSEPGGEGLFDEERRLKKIWRRCPGALTAQALGEAKETLVTGAGTMWSMDRVSLPPLFVHYARTQLLPNMSPVVQQEALTIALAMDSMIQGKIASSLDVLSQRLKALEAGSRGAHWTVTRQMELCRVDAQGISEEGEALGAAKRAREEERLRTMMSKAPAYKGGEASQWGGKTRKGKEGKGTTKGQPHEGGKGKGSSGAKDDQNKGWQKKKE
jgi:hypothetical protein